VPTADAATELRQLGIVLLRDVFEKDSLTVLKEAAERCFARIERGEPPKDHYRFNRFSHSLLLRSLLEFGCDDVDQLCAPLSAPGLETMFSAAMGEEWTCNMEESWVRKKFAPSQAPARPYHPQDWHQDGALGVRFPPETGLAAAMTELLTCWIPLNPCGEHSPSLEFICRPQSGLLHFSELNDADLRKRFPKREFRAPVLEFGDGLVFRNSVLHRTHTRPGMRHNRLSVEYRIFPR